MYNEYAQAFIYLHDPILSYCFCMNKELSENELEDLTETINNTFSTYFRNLEFGPNELVLDKYSPEQEDEYGYIYQFNVKSKTLAIHLESKVLDAYPYPGVDFEIEDCDEYFESEDVVNCWYDIVDEFKAKHKDLVNCRKVNPTLEDWVIEGSMANVDLYQAFCEHCTKE